MSDVPQLQVTQHGDVFVLHLPTELVDEAETLDYFREVFAFVERDQPAKLLISFEHNKLLSTTAIGSLLRTQRRLCEYGGQLRLCGMSQFIRRIFWLCFPKGEVFAIHETCREARESFS